MIQGRIIFICAILLTGTKAFATTFVATRNLSFGTLIPTAASGSVTIALNGAITTNGVVTVAPSGTTYNSGMTVFTGSGLGAVADVVNMTFVTQPVTLSNGVGGTVTVSNFTITPNLQISLLTPSANAAVGGQMNFTAASSPGTYTGNVQIRGNSLLGGTATVTLPITLTLWNALSVKQTQALNFGAIQMSGGNSVVEIAASNGARTVSSGAGGVQLVTNRPGNAGEFLISGQPNTTVTVTLPASTTLTGPGTAMTVNTFTRSPSTTTTLNDGGNLSLKVGARLNIGTAQAPGTYRGTYNLTVSY